MAIKRYFPTRDTTISDFDPNFSVSFPTTASNVGASEILQYYQVSSTPASAAILIGFASASLPSGSQAVLRLRDAQHGETLPAAYTARVQPLEQDWSEGAGQDFDTYTDTGAASWVSATLTSAWAAPGAVPTGTTSATFYFTTGHEDLEVDVTAFANPGFGFRIGIDPAISGVDLYTKRFHSRQTHFPARRPCLEVRWSDWTDSLSTSSFFLVTGSNSPWSGSYVDPRLSGIMSGVSVSVTNSLVDPTGALVFGMYDLRPVFDSSENVVLHLQARPRNWDQAVAPTASSAPSGTALLDAYYRVVDVLTDDVLVPFGTGALPFTKLSWDDQGNYFGFDMSGLPTGTLMRFDFIYRISGSTTFVPGDDFTFRVR